MSSSFIYSSIDSFVNCFLVDYMFVLKFPFLTSSNLDFLFPWVGERGG